MSIHGALPPAPMSLVEHHLTGLQLGMRAMNCQTLVDFKLHLVAREQQPLLLKQRLLLPQSLRLLLQGRVSRSTTTDSPPSPLVVDTHSVGPLIVDVEGVEERVDTVDAALSVAKVVVGEEVGSVGMVRDVVDIVEMEKDVVAIAEMGKDVAAIVEKERCVVGTVERVKEVIADAVEEDIVAEKAKVVAVAVEVIVEGEKVVVEVVTADVALLVTQRQRPRHLRLLETIAR